MNRVHLEGREQFGENAPGLIEALERGHVPVGLELDLGPQRPEPTRRMIAAAGDDAAPGSQRGDHIPQGLGRAHDVVGEDEESRVDALGHTRLLGRPLDQGDVAPTASLDSITCLPKHLQAQLEADEAALRPDPLLQERDRGLEWDVRESVARVLLLVG